MSPTTELVIAEIVRAVANGARIAPATFTACYPRANVSAAFRVARKRGLILVDCLSVYGTPIYRKGLRLASGFVLSRWRCNRPDTMTDAIALSSPSGRMSKRARKAAEERLAKALFGDGSGFFKGEQPVINPAIVKARNLRRAAKDLRDLASRGMSKRKFTRAADRMEQQASEIEAGVSVAGRAVT